MLENPTSPEEARGLRWPNLPFCATRCRKHRIQVATARIGYINAILEGYEWIARIQTEDQGQGILSIDVPEDWDEMFLGAMRGIGERVDVKFLDDSSE